MSIFATIAERRILEAIQEGLFDDLSLKGRPIAHEDLSAVPEELRMGYKILKNAGYLPEELQLKEEIITLQEMIRSSTDPDKVKDVRSKLTLRQLQLEMLMEKRGKNLAWQDYEQQIQNRLINKSKF